MLRKFIIQAIEFYQTTLSPDHGPLRHLYPYGFCRKHPTCSEYCKRSIEERGIIIGGLFGFLRLLCCTPFLAPDPERFHSYGH